LAGTAPRYVEGVMALTAGADVSGEIGGLAVANVGSAVTYLLGGALFGVALWRAQVLRRRASALLAIGALSTILIQVLSKSLDRIPRSSSVWRGRVLASRFGSRRWYAASRHGARSENRRARQRPRGSERCTTLFLGAVDP
jgi:hypothetical protein